MQTNRNPMYIDIQTINWFGTSFRENIPVANMDIQETLKKLSVIKI